MRETIILILLVQISSFIMFLLGIFSSKFLNGNIKPIKTINPVEIIKESKKVKKQKEQEELKRKQLAVLYDNINNYDGSNLGQKEIPRD